MKRFKLKLLETLIEGAGDHARNVMLNSKDELMPVFALASRSETAEMAGKLAISVVGTPWGSEEERAYALEAVRDLMKHLGCFAYSHVCEVWAATQGHAPRDGDLLPSERPDRRECVVAFATDGKKTIVKMLEIKKRGPDGACVDLAEDVDCAGNMFAGRMFELLTPETEH